MIKMNKIFLNQNFASQEEVFQFLGETMRQVGVVDRALDYVDALHKREKQSTTGLIDGFAIPHGKSDLIKDIAIVYIRNTIGIEWNSLDGSPATDIFALAIPTAGSDEHLDILSTLATSLMDPGICKKLRAVASEKEINEVFKL